jgi:putative acetyltransferase
MSDNIKKAVVSDWPDLLVIFSKSLRSTINLSEEDWQKLYERAITHVYPESELYIFIKRNKNVAYIAYSKQEKTIKQLYVLPQYFNQGIGQKLMSYVIKQHPEPMKIGVRTDNDVALHIYTKFGFQKIKEEKYDSSGVYLPHYILERKA